MDDLRKMLEEAARQQAEANKNNAGTDQTQLETLQETFVTLLSGKQAEQEHKE